MEPQPLTIWTVGHSTHELATLLGLLDVHAISALADVRRFPASRRYPHFGREPLAAALGARGGVYEWLPELGGRRQPQPDSPNSGWRNASFRGYADHMTSAEYQAGIERLLALARSHRAAILCAEALWWRCHRSLIADDLKARDIAVLHILSDGSAEPHPFTSAARIVDGRLSYGLTGAAARQPSATNLPLDFEA